MCVLASVGACNGLAAAGGGACCFQELDKNKSLGIFVWSLCCRGWLRAQCCLPYEQEACVSISHSCLLAASAALWAVLHRAVAIQRLRDIFDGHYDSSLLLHFTASLLLLLLYWSFIRFRYFPHIFRRFFRELLGLKWKAVFGKVNETRFYKSNWLPLYWSLVRTCSTLPKTFFS